MQKEDKERVVSELTDKLRNEGSVKCESRGEGKSKRVVDIVAEAKVFGIGGMIYMPLAGGLLTGKVASMDGSRTAQVEEEYGISLGPDNTQFAEFSALCRDLGETESAVAIAWTLAITGWGR